jgi:hypothetical protein
MGRLPSFNEVLYKRFVQDRDRPVSDVQLKQNGDPKFSIEAG